MTDMTQDILAAYDGSPDSGHDVNLQGRNLLKGTDLTAAEFGCLVDPGGRLRMEKRMGLRSSQASIVFDQAGNRLRTIKAVMVATAGDLP